MIDRLKKLREAAAALPDKPGIYYFKNEDGQVIYIGKALSLRNRVRSYFTAVPDVRISHMVAEAAAIDFILTDSEKDALFLESNFIRQHKPRFNVRLKDDKSFPYIKITAGDRFPAVRFSRRIEADGSRYFGPFSPAGRARASVHLINRFFKIRGCSDMVFKTRKRPCLDYELGLCSAPCTGLISEEEYRSNVANACLFLEGKTGQLARIIKVKMKKASQALEYEDAARWRDLLAVIRDIESKPVTISVNLEDRDVLGVYRDSRTVTFCLFFISKGKIIGTRVGVFELGPGRDQGRALLEFISGSYRKDAVSISIIVPYGREETAALNGALAAAGQRARLVAAKTSREKNLIDLALRNARAAAEKKAAVPPGPESLQAVLGLAAHPEIIEGFDISNTGGKETVGSMVVFREGKPDRNSYRKFKIKTVEGPNDTAGLAETVGRRYGRLLKEKARLPELILVDGGKGQLSAALEALRGLGLERIPVVSLAKKEEIIFTPGRPEGLRLKRTSPALKLLQHVRDEAHRLAITFHRSLRSKESFSSALNGIPGVGPKTRAALLAGFGGLEALAAAGEARIAEFAGKKAAGLIYRRLHADREQSRP